VVGVGGPLAGLALVGRFGVVVAFVVGGDWKARGEVDLVRRGAPWWMVGGARVCVRWDLW